MEFSRGFSTPITTRDLSGDGDIQKTNMVGIQWEHVETSWDINPGFSQARMNKQNPVHENMKVNHLQWKLSRIYVP